MNSEIDKVVQVQNLRTYFSTDEGEVPAVDDVSFSLYRGKTLGLVGESGCGKSVSALSIMRLVPRPGQIVGGRIFYKSTNLVDLAPQKIREIRGNKISMIFQEPMTSLNPVFSIGNQIAEAIRLHQKNLTRANVRERCVEMLRYVGIPSPEKRLKDYPHQLSGGMRQRVMIAIALSCNPDLLIADEPTTALDVTIQAQILDLLERLQEEFGMSILLITHDLGVVARVAEDVAVMYCGKIVEYAPVHLIYENPLHPYTVGLLKSIPSFQMMGGKKKRLDTIAGIVPNLLHLPVGCNFQDRCPLVVDRCKREEPELREIESGHWVSCHEV